jgi:hypothetical protein
VHPAIPADITGFNAASFSFLGGACTLFSDSMHGRVACGVYITRVLVNYPLRFANMVPEKQGNDDKNNKQGKKIICFHWPIAN